MDPAPKFEWLVDVSETSHTSKNHKNSRQLLELSTKFDELPSPEMVKFLVKEKLPRAYAIRIITKI